MNSQELIEKITQKKEFSNLPKKDVELAFAQFDKERYLDEEKIKLTRDLLRKVFSAFASTKILLNENFCPTKSKTTPSRRSRGKDFIGHKILKIQNKGAEWILRKHLSTRERLLYYKEVYGRILEGLDKSKKISITDLGAGINGFSYNYFKKVGYDVDYLGVEAIGQFVELSNHYFKKEKLKAEAVHLSLFELEKIRDLIKKTKTPRIVFLFKTIDSLEMLKRDYSKKLLSEIVPLSDRVVVSFATRSMIKREKFKVNRNWIIDFIRDTFNITDDFIVGGERYIVFCKRDE